MKASIFSRVTHRTRRAVVMLEFLLCIVLVLIVTLLAFDVGLTRLTQLEVDRHLTQAATESVQEHGVLDARTTARFEELLDSSLAAQFLGDPVVVFNNQGRHVCTETSQFVDIQATYRVSWLSRQLARLTGDVTPTVSVRTLCVLRGENVGSF